VNDKADVPVGKELPEVSALQMIGGYVVSSRGVEFVGDNGTTVKYDEGLVIVDGEVYTVRAPSGLLIPKTEIDGYIRVKATRSGMVVLTVRF